MALPLVADARPTSAPKTHVRAQAAGMPSLPWGELMAMTLFGLLLLV